MAGEAVGVAACNVLTAAKQSCCYPAERTQDASASPLPPSKDTLKLQAVGKTVEVNLVDIAVQRTGEHLHHPNTLMDYEGGFVMLV